MHSGDFEPHSQTFLTVSVDFVDQCNDVQSKNLDYLTYYLTYFRYNTYVKVKKTKKKNSLPNVGL